VGALEIESALE